MDNLVTCDSIMEWFEEQVAQKHPISPDVWLDGASKLNVLIGSEHEKLFDLEQGVTIFESGLLGRGDTSSSAKTKSRATDLYRQMQTQKAKIRQIEEFIRLAKHRARRASDEIKGY